MDKIKSPITNSFNTRLIKVYPKNDFINLYKESINFDVTRFFLDTKDIFYVKCLDTGYKFFYPYSITGDDIFYEDLQQFDWYYPREKWEFNEALKQINNNDKVLEIGAGNGAFLKKLDNNKDNINAIEFNKKSIAILKGQGYKVYNQTVQELSQVKENYYDVVVSFQVLEHISEVKSFIEASLKVLKKGGKLIFSVPNNGALIMKLDLNLSLNYPPHHMGHWDKKTFYNLQEYFPIKCIDFTHEPLQKKQYPRYYRIIALFLRRKFGIIGKGIDKFVLYPYSEYFIRRFSKNLKGLSLVVTFIKENEKN